MLSACFCPFLFSVGVIQYQKGCCCCCRWTSAKKNIQLVSGQERSRASVCSSGGGGAGNLCARQSLNKVHTHSVCRFWTTGDKKKKERGKTQIQIKVSQPVYVFSLYANADGSWLTDCLSVYFCVFGHLACFGFCFANLF